MRYLLLRFLIKKELKAHKKWHLVHNCMFCQLGSRTVDQIEEFLK